MGKGSFILYDSDLESIEFLNETQRGTLLSALIKYRLHSEKTDFGDDTALKILFHQMSEHIAINEEKYKAICEKRSEAIKKRWSSEKESKNIQEDTNEYKCINENTNVYLNDNDNVNDIDNDIVNVNDNVACGGREKTKERKYYNNYKKKNDVPALLRDEPNYDIDVFMRKAINLKYEKTEPHHKT